MDVIFGMVLINNINVYDWDLDEYLSQEDFIQKIKDDELIRTWGELGPIYGQQWKNWDGVDQIASLIENIKANPNSRRLIVNAWNVSEIDKMTLPPCHYGFQCYVNEGKLSLMWNQRSVDTF